MRGVVLIVNLLFFVFLFPFCKDKEDAQPPVITFLEPGEHFIVTLPDTIMVVAKINDDKNITVVEVSVVNDLGIPVATGGFYYPETPYFMVTSYLALTDKAIPGGNYSIKVTASDYYNITNAYRTIILNEIPKALQAYVAITASLPFESRITKMDTEFIIDTSFVFPKGFHLSGLLSLWDQFFFITPEPSVFYAFNSNDFELLYEFPAWLPRMEFSAILTDFEVLYSTMSGDAGILNSSGQIVVNTEPQTDKTIQCFAADENYMYAEMISPNGNIRELTVFYRGTGGIRAQRQFQQDIVALQPLLGKAVVISNSGVKTVFSEFDPENLLLTELKSIAQEEINSTLKISEDDILVLTGARVLKYAYSTNFIEEYLPGGYNFGRYDEVNDRLYMAKDSLIEIFNSALSIPVIISFDEPLMDFHLVFTKK